jgi:1,4-alpha-glucan branching enzyme
VFRHPRPPPPRAVRVYESHVGIACAEPRVGTYQEFRDNVLPRIVKAGYFLVLELVKSVDVIALFVSLRFV